MLCADVVEVRWTDLSDHPRHSTALLEDISPHGACLQLEVEIRLGTEIAISHASRTMRGTVRYCVYQEIGYFAGVEFQTGSEWSPSQFTPEHLLDTEELLRLNPKHKVRKASGRTD